MATWPSYAKILLAGYSEESDYGVIRTEMDGGLAKQRARWTKAIVTREAQIKVDSASQKASFSDWMRVDLNGGAGWFDFRDPLDGVTKQARIVSGKVTWTSPGVIWVGQCKLETIG